MKISKKVTILGIVLFLLTACAPATIVKPDPQTLAQEILDNLKTTESYNVNRWFFIRMNGDYEWDGVKYSKDADGAEPTFEIYSQMEVTNNPYHLDTEGYVTEKLLLHFGAASAGETKKDYQLTSDETDGMSHLTMDGETRDFKYTYCPSLNLELFEGIADGSIKAEYGQSDDGWKDDLDFLYLDVVVSGDVLKNFFLDEEKVLYGYDLDNADWDSMQVPCRITVDRDEHRYITIETDINHGNNSITSSQIQPLINQSFPSSNYEVAIFHVKWHTYL